MADFKAWSHSVRKANYLVHVQGSSSIRPPSRGGSGRFSPCASAAKRKKGKTKAKLKPAEIIIKDICLLPAPSD